MVCETFQNIFLFNIVYCHIKRPFDHSVILKMPMPIIDHHIKLNNTYKSLINLFVIMRNAHTAHSQCKNEKIEEKTETSQSNKNNLIKSSN